MTDAETLLPCPSDELDQLIHLCEHYMPDATKIRSNGVRVFMDCVDDLLEFLKRNKSDRTVSAPVVSRIEVSAAKHWFNETFNNPECDDPEIKTIRTLLEAAAKETT